MQIKIVFLGTAGSSPTKDRSLPSVALIREGHLLLFDCGEGTQSQMIKLGVNPSRLDAIFVSHLHGDHVIGIAGLVRTLALNGRKNPLTIFVPRGYESPIKALISFDKAMIGYDIMVKGIGSGTVFRSKDFSVSSFRLNHTIPTCGYIFKENDRRKFDKERCKRLGLKGIMFSELEKKGRVKVGKKTITLNSVTTIKKGKKIIYASDTRPVAATVSASRDADLLIHESSYLDNHVALAKERGHSTAREAAQLAKKAHVKRLILTHISARYKDVKAIEEEAKKTFRNTTVARDGDSVEID